MANVGNVFYPTFLVGLESYRHLFLADCHTGVKKSLKLLRTDAFPTRKICQKCVCSRGSAPNPAGELIALPQTAYLDLRDLILRGGQGRAEESIGEGRRERKGAGGENGEKGEKGKGRKWVIPVLLLLHFEPYRQVTVVNSAECRG